VIDKVAFPLSLRRKLMMCVDEQFADEKNFLLQKLAALQSTGGGGGGGSAGNGISGGATH